MTGECEWNDGFENRVVRIPEAARVKYSLPVGSFLHLRDKHGQLFPLQIVPAFKEDTHSDAIAGYVTEKVYNYLAIVQDFEQEVERVANITLGCDPEAFLMDAKTGHIVSATRFFRRMGDVGHDGMLLEFRPMPSVHAEVVTSNIWRLIQKGRRELNARGEGNRIIMVASSGLQGLTAGFHLHYGLPYALLGRRPPVRHLANLMVTLFDYYIGVPAVIPEGEVDHHRRTVSYVDYGKPGGYRLDNRTFEFRLPGGSLLRHPVLTAGLMSLGAVVVEDFVSRVREATDNFTGITDIHSLTDIRMLYPNLPHPLDIHSLIVSVNLQPARERMATIVNDIRKMVGYKERATAVEAFFSCIENDTKFSSNIEENWGGYYHAEQQGQMGVL
jgi:hypothetical protein